MKENKILVEALDTYEKNNIKDEILGRMPKEGEQFEVTTDRLNVLTGNNSYQLVFVKEIKTEKINNLVEEDIVPIKKEKAFKKKTTK